LQEEFARSPYSQKRFEPGHWQERDAQFTLAWLDLLVGGLLPELFAQYVPSRLAFDFLAADAQTSQRADIGNRPMLSHVSQDLFRYQPSLGGIGKNLEKRKQLFGLANLIEID